MFDFFPFPDHCILVTLYDSIISYSHVYRIDYYYSYCGSCRLSYANKYKNNINVSFRRRPTTRRYRRYDHTTGDAVDDESTGKSFSSTGREIRRNAARSSTGFDKYGSGGHGSRRLEYAPRLRVLSVRRRRRVRKQRSCGRDFVKY